MSILEKCEHLGQERNGVKLSKNKKSKVQGFWRFPSITGFFLSPKIYLFAYL